MTEQELDQAARLAAIRARRGQSPIAVTKTVAPAATTQPAISWAPPVAHEVQIPAPPLAAARATVAAAAPAARPAATRPPTSRTASAAAVRPKSKKAHPHIAAGARIVVTGLTASGIFGLTTVIAAANQPKTVTVADPGAPTTLYADPTATTLPGTTLVPGETVPPTGSTVVLSIPPMGGASSVAVVPAGQPAPVKPAVPAQQPSQPAPVTQAPAVTQAPVVTPAPTPPPTAAPVTTTPPPATTTCTSANHKKGLC